MRRIGMIGLTAAAVVSATALTVAGDDYQVDVVLPSATNLNEGSPVLVHGLEVGTLERIAVQDGKARLTLTLDEHAPLHDGAQVLVKWRALVGERYVEIHDGPSRNAEVPTGGLLPGKATAPMEIDQVLAALDEPTRERLKSLIGRLRSTATGNEDELRATLNSAGPAISALGDVLEGVGSDGEAISQLVTQLDDLLGTVAAGDKNVRRVIERLGDLAAGTAAERTQLARTLEKAPGTLDQAKRTLGRVPGAVDEAAPLLDDLQPATALLPRVARQLKPLLADLRPLSAKLRPTLGAADELLGHTPGLLDTAHDVQPGLNTALADLRTPLHFLRPYTPEVAGALSNWSSALGNYSGSGHYARFNVSYGAHSYGGNPGIVPPGYTKDETPAPGSLVGQPWTDAYGSGVR